MKKRVALLVGGWSSERQVSLNKGKHIEKALIEGGYDVKVVDVTTDLQKLITDLTPRPDAVFNNLYGRGGEDGTIQAVLEMLHIPYTHSGVVASAVGMDKNLTKIMAETVGVRVAEGRIASKQDVLAETVMPRPYVVKPVNEGSSVGVRIILEGDNQMPLDAASWTFGDEVLVEKYIPGREIHVAVLDGKAQGVTEILVAGRFFDYDAKYSDARTELVTPAKVPEIVAKTAMEFSERVYKVLGCAGLARCDMRYDDSKPGADGVYLLEINTMPGLSPGSIALIQPELNGMSYVQLCSHLVETARCHASNEKNGTRQSVIRDRQRRQAKGSRLIEIGRRFGLTTGLVLFAMWAGAWLYYSGSFERAGDAVSTAFENKTASHGFAIQDILVEGRTNADPQVLLGLINAERGDSMFGFDPDRARIALEQLPWIKSARVERRLPGIVYVSIDERKPYALWQQKGKVSLIDPDGVKITDVPAEMAKFHRLPLVVGDGAPGHARDLFSLVNSEPDIANRVEAAIFVGERRWDLQLKNNVQINLPEDDIGLALSRLAGEQEHNGLLDRNELETIDLREPARIVVRNKAGTVQDYKASFKAGSAI